MTNPQTFWISRFCRRLMNLFRRSPIEAAMDDEMRYHIECEAAERIRQGMDSAEAWRTASRDFGGIECHKEAARDVRGLRVIDDTLRDMTYSLRVLRANRSFSAAVVLTFALGIGCTSAIFSLVNGILLRPLPYYQPAGLVTLWERNEARKGGLNVVSLETYEAWRQELHSFTDIAAIVPVPLTLDGEPSERTTGAEVSTEYFRMLGVRPAMGRDFVPGDGTNTNAPVAILSYGLWKERLGADPAIIGRTILMDGRPVTIVGVMSAEFEPPRFGWLGEQPLWLPFVPTPDKRSWGRFLQIVARVRPGVGIEQAGAEMLAISGRLAREIPANKGWSASVVSLSETITGDVRTPLIVLFTAVTLLLLMSIVNVGSLVTAFARGREHEFAVRRAIGATASRLLRQQLLQSTMLGVCGTSVGIALAFVGIRILVTLAPVSVPRLIDVRLDLTVVVFASVLAFIATIAFGLASAFRALAQSNVGSSFARTSTVRTTVRLQGSRIIVAEIAIGLVLTVFAVLMVRSLSNLRSVDLGFDAGSLVTGRVSLPSARYPDDERSHIFFEQLLERVRTIPGVTGASLVTSRPFACCGPATPVRDPSQPAMIESAPITDVRYADDSYFATARIPMLSGAGFSASERRQGPNNVVVSRSLAQALWGATDPVGKTVSMALYGGITARVIGVVGDVQLKDPHSRIRPTAYLSTERFPSSERDILVRANGDSNNLIRELRSAVAAVDATIPLYRATSLAESVSETLAQDRFTTVLLGSFAVVSLMLAAVGVYGVLSGDANLRRKEIGIRLALGASGVGVMALLLRRALRPAIMGAAIGVMIALLLARSMSALVFGIVPWDPLSFALVTAALLAVAAAATLIPAFRATRVSPLEVIRID